MILGALYFDNFPHGHYGTIRQQFWSLLHFPLQLAIVGVVEGSQQLALARYVAKNAEKVSNSIIEYCQTENLDGQKLQDKLMSLLDYFELDSKLETAGYYDFVLDAIWNVGNTTGICSAENAASYNNENATWPDEIVAVDMGLSNGLYAGLGMKLPIDKLEEYTPLEVAVEGWRLVYLYYWSSFCLLIACLIIFLFLIRRHKADLFDFTSVITRFIVFGIGGAMMALMGNDVKLYNAISSPALLPICVFLLFLILVIDKLSSVWCNWRLKKSGQTYALEYEEHGHHEHHSSHGSGHGEIHESGPLHGHVAHDSISGLEDMRKSARWSTHSDTVPLASSTEYHSPGQQSYAMTPLMSPPLMSPDPVAPPHSHTPAPGGYMPVSSGQHYGA
ncbi:hypothetical protein N0V83_005972 [Neocucurbitaria cava]|uniref:Uncharacterized protein n=1 Tax=Neocucurbitaria cava TaxID=798079 RepID=A0A9W8Y941_9PLEO|nr:hypothetical protein N0V83_005972 [Neocucurbitaria cava]